MRFGPLAVAEAAGAVLAHSVAAGGLRLRKGALLTQADCAQLAEAGVTSVIAARLEPGDLGEDEAAQRLAAALGAANCVIRSAATGRVNIHAASAGLFSVDADAVNAINEVDPAVTLATLADKARVEAGQMVATVKIIPFAVSALPVDRAAMLASGAMEVLPFRSVRAGLVQTTLPGVKANVLDKTVRITAERLARSGSSIWREIRVPHDSQSVTEAIKALAADCGLVLVFGASAMSDPRDVIPEAISLAGGMVERVGMPVDPGNLLVTGSVGGIAVIGAPGCARSPKENGFDWVLDRFLAGVPASAADIAKMGVGGLLTEIASRPSPRERPAEKLEVAAIVLAAGRSSRMGGPNKLMALFDGVPLIRRSVETALESPASPVVVVTGHQSEIASAALSGLDAEIHFNPAYAEGLSTSLKAGIAALPAAASGALVMLADMPSVSAKDIAKLIAAFSSHGGTAVIRACNAGQPGNPVILPRSLFSAAGELSGDMGAKMLIARSGLEIADVEIGAAAGIDVDTPEALEALGGMMSG